MDNEVPFRTMNSGYLDKDIFKLNPLNQFLIKNYPREELGSYWTAYLFTRLVEARDDLNDVSLIITPEEYYNMCNSSISNCFDKWVEMFKNDTALKFKHTILDSIPGTSKHLSIEFEGIPEDVKIALSEGLTRITNEAKIYRGKETDFTKDFRTY